MADIFQEVDEELRQERYAKLWKKYGTYVVGAVVAVVLVVGGYTGWREYRQGEQEAQGEAFAAALIQAETGADEAAASAFIRLADSAADGYAVLSRLQAAEARTRSGDTAGAVAIFDAIISDASTDPVFRDLAVLLLALQTLDSADPAALTERLRPLIIETSPWRFTAQELTALLSRHN